MSISRLHSKGLPQEPAIEEEELSEFDQKIKDIASLIPNATLAKINQIADGPNYPLPNLESLDPMPMYIGADVGRYESASWEQEEVFKAKLHNTPIRQKYQLRGWSDIEYINPRSEKIRPYLSSMDKCLKIYITALCIDQARIALLEKNYDFNGERKNNYRYSKSPGPLSHLSNGKLKDFKIEIDNLQTAQLQNMELLFKVVSDEEFPGIDSKGLLNGPSRDHILDEDIGIRNCILMANLNHTLRNITNEYSRRP